jgi:hypothetical protein
MKAIRRLAFKTAVAVFLTGLLVWRPTTVAADLVVNGDFEAGNTAFGSDYGFLSAPRQLFGFTGTYGIDDDPLEYWPDPAIISFVDHTTGSGLMFIGDGGPTSRVWFQDILVTAGQNYTYSAWITDILALSTAAPRATLSFEIDGINVGVFDLTGIEGGDWTNFSVNWNATTTTTVQLVIRSLDPEPDGNNFAIDDISFSPVSVPEPSSIALLLTGTLGIIGYGWRRKKQLDT